VTLQWQHGNLWGRNLTFTAAGKADFPFSRYIVRDCPPNSIEASQCSESFQPPPDPVERIIDLGITAPRLSPLTDVLRGSVDLIHERTIQQSYRLFKVSGQATIGLARPRPLNAEMAYEVGFQSLALGQRSLDEALAGIDNRIFNQPSGDMLFGSLRPAITLDLRDDPARPRSGFVAQLSGDWLRSFAASEVNAHLFKVQGLVAQYIPLPALSSLVLSVRGGRIFQLNSRSSTPGDRRFYLGGATTLRGFHENALQPQDLRDKLHQEVRACAGTLSSFACSQEALLVQAGATSSGGDLFVAAGAEMRVSFAPTLEAAVFYDVGNLWSDPTKFRETFALRDAVGAGLRWLTPIGRLAIDIGYNLHPDPVLGEPQFGPYFSIDPL
jgi:outer membrane protein assembly factor BamA